MKKMLVIIMIGVLITMLSACSTKGLDVYNKASTKTSSEQMGKTSYEIKVDMDFNTDGLTLEETRELSYLKEMIFEINNQYDITKEKIATDIYMNLGGVGIDSNYYRNGDKQYIRIPVLRKYIDMDEKKGMDMTKNYGNHFSDIEEKWLELLEEDDVVKGENTIIDTKEGQVKAKIVTITINEEQLKEFSNEVIKIVMESGIMDNFVFVKDVEFDKDKLKETIVAQMEKIEFDSFEAKAYIDFDGYLIKEVMNIGMKMIDAGKGEPTSIKISITNEAWDIGKEQNIQIPEINEDDIIKMEELEDLDNILGL